MQEVPKYLHPAENLQTSVCQRCENTFASPQNRQSWNFIFANVKTRQMLAHAKLRCTMCVRHIVQAWNKLKATAEKNCEYKRKLENFKRHLIRHQGFIPPAVKELEQNLFCEQAKPVLDKLNHLKKRYMLIVQKAEQASR